MHSTKKLDRAFNKVFKQEALISNSMACEYCFDELKVSNSTIEHKIPISLSGQKHKKDNITASCRRCNVTKGNMLHEIFMKKINSPSWDMKFTSIYISRKSTNKQENQLTIYQKNLEFL